MTERLWNQLRHRTSGLRRRAGFIVLAFVGLLALAAPLAAPQDPATAFANCLHAPPMRLHVRDTDGTWRRPFVHPLRLVSRLESKYEELTAVVVPLGRAIRLTADPTSDAGAQPTCSAWLPLGADSFGRDVASRVLYGARISLAVALLSVLGSVILGAILGGLAGYFGGFADDGVMRFAEFIIVLPTVYLVLALRAIMPLVLPPADVFGLMIGIFTLVGWPWVARGVRAIVAAERRREYVDAARAAGAGHARVVARHLLPATFGYLGTQATLLVPAFILAEATLSFVGLGFPEGTATWGTMLQEATNVSALAQYPWVLSPAVAVFLVVLGVNLAVENAGSPRVESQRQLTPAPASGTPEATA